MMQLIDVHSHLQDKAYDADREMVIARMKEAGVSTIIVGTDKKMSEDGVALAEKHDPVKSQGDHGAGLWATVGLHPTDNIEEGFDYDFYKKLAQNPRVVGIGECGLDYYRLKVEGGRAEEEKERQKEIFQEHIQLAHEIGKPLMLHCRPTASTQDAYLDMLDVLASSQQLGARSFPGNAHFFAGSWETAQKFLNLGFTLSFTGVITFTHGYDDIIKNTPLDMLMVETDAPYVAPVPYRGKRNEPLYVTEVVKRVAEIKGETFEKVAEETSSNAKRVFGLDASR